MRLCVSNPWNLGKNVSHVAYSGEICVDVGVHYIRWTSMKTLDPRLVRGPHPSLRQANVTCASGLVK